MILNCCKEQFIKDKEEWFIYMCNNYKYMIIDNHILHFDIIGGLWHINTEHIKNSSINEIEHNLISWIKDEIAKGELLKSYNWTEIPEPDVITSMILEYKYNYTYNRMLFKLILLDECEDCSECKDCINKYISKVRFSLAYYEGEEET